MVVVAEIPGQETSKFKRFDVKLSAVSLNVVAEFLFKTHDVGAP
jgi:hypothetical protein